MGFRLLVPSIITFLTVSPYQGRAAVGSISEGGSSAGKLVYAHSHNDYVNHRPLLDAIEKRFYSVEADIWLRENRLIVSHYGNHTAGFLDEVYLKPLADRIKELGSVHGDGLTFYLWIDIKDKNPALDKALHRLLSKYPIFTRFTDGEIEYKPVTVILTGNHERKLSYVETYSTRWACRDSNFYSAKDPLIDRKWRFYAIDWFKNFKWRGHYPISKGELRKLTMMVKNIHLKGRKVRFYNAPDTDRYWKLALRLKIDFINTNEVSQLNRFLASQ